jgi:hypothetical protein
VDETELPVAVPEVTLALINVHEVRVAEVSVTVVRVLLDVLESLDCVIDV